MKKESATKFDETMAYVCERCPVCSQARRKQKGVAFRFVSAVEENICPFCRAYEKTHGRKAHEPLN